MRTRESYYQGSWWNRIRQYFNPNHGLGWSTRGTGESLWDVAEWSAPNGMRGVYRPPFWYIVYVWFKERRKNNG